MDPSIKILMDEHKNILTVVDKLEKECTEIEKGKRINKRFLERTIKFIRNYADKFHHAKEEEILFEEFGKTAERGRLHCNPVEQMRYEHDLGRDLVKGMIHFLKQKNNQKLVEKARGYVNLIREHIFKEDNILYPMAEKSLKPIILESIFDQFKTIERKNEGLRKCLEFVKEI